MSRRTSISHPLQIATVSAGTGMGRVGITFCPGKKQHDALTGAWDRNLDLDVATIADWGAASVVTLVEAHELEALGVTGLGEAVGRHQLGWWHLPIRDVSVPDAAFEQEWSTVGPLLRSQLHAGFDVLVHCKGGLGRAGTVASRLLVDAGWSPFDALSAVRAARPGAVETQSQARYVAALKPVTAPQPRLDDTAIRDRAAGALLGLAVGDAVGTTLEFAGRDTKPLLADMVGGGPFRLKPGEWTDDTAMALALADSLVEHPQLDARDLMERFVAWYRKGAYSCTDTCFDIGVTTRLALASFERSGDPYAGSTDPMAAGNGSLMRLAPVAIRYWRDADSRADVAARQSRTTHAAPEAIAACVAYADIIADAISGKSRDEVLLETRESAVTSVATVITGSWRGKRRSEIKSSGYVLHTLEAALWCVGRTADFRSAVLLAANLADDADTVAAVTGQLAGALYGRSGIPAEWLDRLAWRERIEQTALELVVEATA